MVRSVLNRTLRRLRAGSGGGFLGCSSKSRKNVMARRISKAAKFALIDSRKIFWGEKELGTRCPKENKKNKKNRISEMRIMMPLLGRKK
jgi:hypothetical protein